jgi:hypothetical protein
VPTLSDATRRALKYLRGGGSAHGLNAGSLACWNWALTGFGLNPINPDLICSYVAGTAGDGDLNAAGGWFAQPGNQALLLAVRDQWGDEVMDNYDTALTHACFECLKLAIRANGLTWSAGATPYEVCMYYASGPDVEGIARGPNWTHWWLQIDGGGAAGHNDGIEAFPGTNYVTIRRPEYSTHHVSRAYVTGLHQTHVQTIGQALQTVARQRRPVVGAWVADETSNNCQICNDLFTWINRRHHCRHCGRLVCGSCSPYTRLVAPRAANSPQENGAVRVCNQCL